MSHDHDLPPDDVMLNNTVPAMGIQNGLARSNIRCLSFYSSTYVFPSPTLTFPFGLGRMVMLVAVALLVLMSGDVEINPGLLVSILLKSIPDSKLLKSA